MGMASTWQAVHRAALCLQELRQLFHEAAAESAQEAPAASMETTQRADFQAHDMHRMQ
jgi:ubiquitin-protein ligase